MVLESNLEEHYNLPVKLLIVELLLRYCWRILSYIYYWNTIGDKFCWHRVTVDMYYLQHERPCCKERASTYDAWASRKNDSRQLYAGEDLLAVHFVHFEMWTFNYGAERNIPIDYCRRSRPRTVPDTQRRYTGYFGLFNKLIVYILSWTTNARNDTTPLLCKYFGSVITNNSFKYHRLISASELFRKCD